MAPYLCMALFMVYLNELRVYAVRSEAEPPHKVQLNFKPPSFDLVCGCLDFYRDFSGLLRE